MFKSKLKSEINPSCLFYLNEYTLRGFDLRAERKIVPQKSDCSSHSDVMNVNAASNNAPDDDCRTFRPLSGYFSRPVTLDFALSFTGRDSEAIYAKQRMHCVNSDCVQFM